MVQISTVRAAFAEPIMVKLHRFLRHKIGYSSFIQHLSPADHRVIEVVTSATALRVGRGHTGKGQADASPLHFPRLQGKVARTHHMQHKKRCSKSQGRSAAFRPYLLINLLSSCDFTVSGIGSLRRGAAAIAIFSGCGLIAQRNSKLATHSRLDSRNWPSMAKPAIAMNVQ